MLSLDIKPSNGKLDLTGHNIFIDGTKLSRVGMYCAEVSTKFIGVVIDAYCYMKLCLSFKLHVFGDSSSYE